MKTWIVSEYFYPEEVSTAYFLTQISKKLYTREKQLCVITKYLNLSKSQQKDVKNICKEILQIKNLNLKNNNLFFKFLNQFTLSINFFYKCFYNIKNNSRVIIVTNPTFLVLFISILKKIKKFEYILIVHDIFPDNLIPIKYFSKDSYFYILLDYIFTNAYNTADKLIVIGDDMKQLLINKKISTRKITTIPNWADSFEIYPIANFNIELYYGNIFKNKIVIQFAGNVGKLQGLNNFIKLFNIANNDEIILIIIGSGTEFDTLLNNNVNKNILFYNPKPRTEQNKFLNACDISLITLIEGMYGIGVPSKTYNIMSAGNPILYIGDCESEVYNYIQKEDIGWNFLWNQTSSIIQFLQNIKLSDKEKFSLIGQKSRKFAEDNFTKEIILNNYQKIVFK
jgi:glycosyltransferase involved in cell wall biosynthesis